MTVDTYLDLLDAAGLIRLAQLEPEIEYLFRHALVQEAAYESLLKQDRRVLHRAVGEALEFHYAEHPELAATLARHFDVAGEPAKAFGYYVAAGDHSMMQYANEEASIHFAHALALTDKAQIDKDRRKDIYLKCGRALEYLGSYADALANYEAMEADARQRGDGGMEIESIVRRASIYGLPSDEHDSTKALSMLYSALEVAEQIGDQAAQASIHWSLIISEKFAGNAPAAQVHGEQALKLAQNVGDDELMAYILNDLSIHVYLDLGRHREGLASSLAAGTLWRKLNNQAMLADSLSGAANMAYLLGKYEESTAWALEARTISEEIDSLWGQSWSRWSMGDLLADQGMIADAVVDMNACIDLGERVGFRTPMINAGVNLAHVYLFLGHLDEAFAWGQKALLRAEEDFPFWRRGVVAFLARLAVHRGDLPEARRLLENMAGGTGTFASEFYLNQFQPCLAVAEVALASGELVEASAALDDLLGYMERSETHPYRPDALTLQGRASLMAGDWDKAREWLMQARAEAESLGSKRMLWRILAALAECEDLAGNSTEAHALRDQAREIVGFIAAHCPDDLRESFLALPEVASLAL